MSDQYRIRPILNEEYKFKTPRLIAAWLADRKYVVGGLFAVVAVITALSVRYDKEIGAWFERAGGTLDKFFRNPKNDWMYLILLLVLLQIYRKFPAFFVPATVVCVLGLMVLLCFQYNNFNSDHVLNKWLIVGAFVVPVIPLIAVMVKTNTGWMHWAVMAVYICLVALFLIVNPSEFLGKYNQDTSTVFVVALVGLFSMICVYVNKSFTQEAWPTYISKLGFVLLCLVTAGFSLQYAIRFFMQKPDFSTNYLLMLAVLIGFGLMFLGILIMRLPRPKLTKLWLAVVYCYVRDSLSSVKGMALYLLLVEVALIVWYFLSVKMYTKLEEGSTGKQLFNEPMPLRKEKSVNVPFNFKGNYALSFWVYLVPQSTQESANASTFVNVLDYGGKPKVSYNASSNTLRVTVRTPLENKKPTEIEKKHAYDAAYDAAIMAGATEAEATASGNRAYEAVGNETVGDDVLMADIPKVPLQRWHHMVLAYNNGTFDIFLNGLLFRSQPGVMTDAISSSIVVGAPRGTRGKICNLVFYNEKTDPTKPFTQKTVAISAAKVAKVYNGFASKNPPIVTRVFSVAPAPSYAQKRYPQPVS